MTHISNDGRYLRHHYKFMHDVISGEKNSHYKMVRLKLTILINRLRLIAIAMRHTNGKTIQEVRTMVLAHSGYQNVHTM